MNWRELKSDPLPPAVSYDHDDSLTLSCLRCGDPAQVGDVNYCHFCEQFPFCDICNKWHNCNKRYDDPTDDTPERAGE